MKKYYLLILIILSNFFIYNNVNSFDLVSNPSDLQKGTLPINYSIASYCTSGCGWAFYQASFSEIRYNGIGIPGTQTSGTYMSGYDTDTNYNYSNLDNGYLYIETRYGNYLIDDTNHLLISNTPNFFYIGNNRFIFFTNNSLIVKDYNFTNKNFNIIQSNNLPNGFIQPNVKDNGFSYFNSPYFYYTSNGKLNTYNVNTNQFTSEDIGTNNYLIGLKEIQKTLISNKTTPFNLKLDSYSNGIKLNNSSNKNFLTSLKNITSFENPNYYFKGLDNQIYKYDINCKNFEYSSCMLDFGLNKFYCTDSNGVKDIENIECNKTFNINNTGNGGNTNTNTGGNLSSIGGPKFIVDENSKEANGGYKKGVYCKYFDTTPENLTGSTNEVSLNQVIQGMRLDKEYSLSDFNNLKFKKDNNGEIFIVMNDDRYKVDFSKNKVKEVITKEDTSILSNILTFFQGEKTFTNIINLKEKLITLTGNKVKDGFKGIIKNIDPKFNELLTIVEKKFFSCEGNQCLFVDESNNKLKQTTLYGNYDKPIYVPMDVKGKLSLLILSDPK